MVALTGRDRSTPDVAVGRCRCSGCGIIGHEGLPSRGSVTGMPNRDQPPSIYRTPDAEVAVRRLYERTRLALPFATGEQVVDTTLGPTHVLTAGRSDGRTVVFLQGGNVVNPITLGWLGALVLAGERDPLFPPARVLPRARVLFPTLAAAEVIPGAGHILGADGVGVLGRRLDAFLGAAPVAG